MPFTFTRTSKNAICGSCSYIPGLSFCPSSMQNLARTPRESLCKGESKCDWTHGSSDTETELWNSATGRKFPQRLSYGQLALRPIQFSIPFLVRKTEGEFARTNTWKSPNGQACGRSATVPRYRIRGRKSHTRPPHSTPCVRAVFSPATSRRLFGAGRKKHSCFQPWVSWRQS